NGNIKSEPIRSAKASIVMVGPGAGLSVNVMNDSLLIFRTTGKFIIYHAIITINIWNPADILASIHFSFFKAYQSIGSDSVDRIIAARLAGVSRNLLIR